MKTLHLSHLWNDSLILEDRPAKAREYGWASELSKSLIDRYLAMRGVEPSNRPNARSRRKFFAGNIWEFVAGLVIAQLGLMAEQQQVVWVEDCAIPIKGKLDYLVQGIPNYSAARDTLNKLPLQKEIIDRFLKTIDLFEQTYGYEEIQPMVHEIKSCSEFVIDKITGGGCIVGHDRQIYHYLRGLKMPTGHIDYISKNDSLMAERIITQSEDIKIQYESDLSKLKTYIDANEQPPKEPLILFEEKFTKNFNVEYSNYITDIYGFKEPSDYSDLVKGKIASFNRVLKRIKDIDDGKTTAPSKKFPAGQKIKLTPKNEIALAEMEKEGFDAYALAKIANVPEEAEEEMA